MKPTEPFEDRLPAALADLAQPLTSDYLPDLLVRTRRVRQRPAWTFPERWIPMTVITRRAPGTSIRGLRVAMGLSVAILLALILAIGMLLAIGSAPPSLVVAPRNGVIAYSFKGDIWLADADGGAPRLLVGGPTVDEGPWWSRDGTRLVFVRVVDGGEQLVSVDPAGADLRLLTQEPVTGMTWYDWSPDSRQIVIAHGPASDGNSSLALGAADGSGITPLETGMGAAFPSFHPDGSKILFRGFRDGVAGLYTVPAEGGEVSGPYRQSDTTTDFYRTWGDKFDLLEPSWSPDGAWIAYHNVDRVPLAGVDGDAAFRVHVMRADGSQHRLIEVSPESDDEWGAAWSPDGAALAIKTIDAVPAAQDVLGRPAVQVAVVPAVGGSPLELLPPITSALTSTDLSPADPLSTTALWSPDGGRILGVDEGSGTAHVIDVRTGESKAMPWRAEAGHSWQPLFDE
jgi:tricorn protease